MCLVQQMGKRFFCGDGTLTLFIMKNATHAKIPLESWQEIVVCLNKTY